MPVPSREQSQALLAPAPDPPAWQGWAVRIRAVMDWVYELGPSVVAACLLLLAFYFTPLPPIAAKAPLSVPPVQASVQSIASQPAAAETAVSPPTPAATPSPAVPVKLLSAEVLAAKYADHNWAAQIAIALVCALLVVTVAVRYLILASRPKVSD